MSKCKYTDWYVAFLRNNVYSENRAIGSTVEFQKIGIFSLMDHQKSQKKSRKIIKSLRLQNYFNEILIEMYCISIQSMLPLFNFLEWKKYQMV